MLNNSYLDIIACTHDIYVSEALLTNRFAIYDFAATSPDGAELGLLRPDQTEYLTLLFTNLENGGTFYEESYAAIGGDISTRYGTFNLALAPQINTSSESVTARTAAPLNSPIPPL